MNEVFESVGFDDVECSTLCGVGAKVHFSDEPFKGQKKKKLIEKKERKKNKERKKERKVNSATSERPKTHSHIYTQTPRALWRFAMSMLLAEVHQIDHALGKRRKIHFQILLLANATEKILKNERRERERHTVIRTHKLVGKVQTK